MCHIPVSDEISWCFLWSRSMMLWSLDTENGGTAAAAPPPFRTGNPALCRSCSLVTPYYCRLGDLLYYNCMLYLSYDFVCMHVHFVFSLFSGFFSFVDFPSVLWYCWLGLLTCKNRLPYNLYCVGGDVKHCTIQSNLDTENTWITSCWIIFDVLRPIWSRYFNVTGIFCQFCGIYGIDDLESHFEVTRGCWFRYKSKSRIWLPIGPRW